MTLRQMQMSYDAEQDRILLRASFSVNDSQPQQEVRAWLTRRLVRNLWPGIVRALESQVMLDKPQAALAKTELVGLDHRESVARFTADGNFARPFEEQACMFPLGEAPILVTAARFTLGSNKPVRIDFAPRSGKGFEIAFTQALLHGFCKLLKDAVRSADWELDLELPAAGIGMPPAARMLN